MADGAEGAELFRGLAADDRAALVALGTPRELANAEVLFRLGDPAEHLYVVLRGHLSLSLPMELRGVKQEAFAGDVGPGETLGWSAVVPPHKYTMSATTTVDSALLRFGGEALRRFLEEHPATGVIVLGNLLALVARRLRGVQAMWLRELERMLAARYARGGT